MALQEQKRPNGAVQGPSMFAPDLPPNPSDAIFQGAKLPTRPAVTQTERRPFHPTVVTKNPLHYNDGPGTDEAVTSRRPAPAPKTPTYESDHKDYFDGDFGDGDVRRPADTHTLRGQEIRGT